MLTATAEANLNINNNDGDREIICTANNQNSTEEEDEGNQSSENTSLINKPLAGQSQTYGTATNTANPDEILDIPNETSSSSLDDESSSPNAYLYTIDCIISVIFFTPISALYNYGTWAIFYAYVLPNNPFLSGLVCYIGGLFILMPGYVFQEKFQEFYDNRSDSVKFLLSRLHIYIISLAYQMEWYGCWTICDKYILLSWRGDLSLAAIALAYMLITRSFRFITSPPFLLAKDSKDYYFLARSRYKFKRLRSSHAQYAFDFMIAELVESFVSITAWRDLALIADLNLYPNNVTANIIASAIIGYSIYFVLVLTQYKAYKHASKYTLIPRLIVEDLYQFFMFLSVIILWRIYWTIPDALNSVDEYKLQFYLASHFGSYLLAVLFSSSCVVTGFGYDHKDGELNEARNFFLVSYLSEHFASDNT